MLWKLENWATAPGNEDGQYGGLREFSSIEELCEFLQSRYGGDDADQSLFGWGVKISISKEQEY